MRSPLFSCVVPLVTLAASCAGAAPDHASSPPAPPPAASASSSAHTPPRPASSALRPVAPDRCEPVVEAQLRSLEPKLGALWANDARLDAAAWLRSLCAPDASGAWALVVTDVALEVPNFWRPGYEGRAKIVRFDAQGHRVEGAEQALSWPRRTVVNDEGVIAELSKLLSPFDHDGDGVPEVVLPNGDDELDPNGTISKAADRVVLTMAGGKLGPYGKAAGFDHIRDVRDVDGDGRPDLLYAGPYEEPIGTYLLNNHELLLVAHAQRDGTFSATDMVAKGAVREQCEPFDAPSTLPSAFARCSRLRGKSEAEVVAALTAHCKSAGAVDCHTALLWAKRTPPFVLQ